MGIRTEFIIFKKEIYKYFREQYSDLSFNEIYWDYLSVYNYPKEYNIPKCKKSRFIFGCNFNIIKRYFKEDKLQIGDVFIITKYKYQYILKSLEEDLENITLKDIMDRTYKEYDEDTYINYMHLYKALKNIKIDWDIELLICEISD